MRTIFYLIITCVSLSCVAQKSNLKNSTAANKLTIKYKDYEILDSTRMKPFMVSFVIDQMPTDITYNIYYDDKNLAEVELDNEGNIKSRNVFDTENDKIYNFVYKGDNVYYSILKPEEYKSTYYEYPRQVKLNKLIAEEAKGIKTFELFEQDTSIIIHVKVDQNIPCNYFNKSENYTVGYPIGFTFSGLGLRANFGITEKRQVDDASAFFSTDITNAKPLSEIEADTKSLLSNSLNIEREKYFVSNANARIIEDTINILTGESHEIEDYSFECNDTNIQIAYNDLKYESKENIKGKISDVINNNDDVTVVKYKDQFSEKYILHITEFESEPVQVTFWKARIGFRYVATILSPSHMTHSQVGKLIERLIPHISKEFTDKPIKYKEMDY